MTCLDWLEKGRGGGQALQGNRKVVGRVFEPLRIGVPDPEEQAVSDVDGTLRPACGEGDDRPGD